jgi:hypothetical protein
MEGHFIEGEIEAWTIVSVPVTTSLNQMHCIQKILQARFQKPVLIIAHNTSFLKAVRLSPKEAARVIKYGEDHAEARTKAVEAYPAQQEGVGGGADSDGDGDRSGVCVDGSSSAGETDGAETELPVCGSDSDEEGGEEGSEGAESNG